MSPSLSVENDSNQSMDIAPVTPDILSMASIVEETKQDPNSGQNTDTNSDYDISSQLTGPKLESNFASTLTEDTTSLTSQTPTANTSTMSQSPSRLNSVDYTNLKQNAASPAIDSSDLMESIDELPPLTIECVSQEPPTVTNTSSSSRTTKKKTTDSSSGT